MERQEDQNEATKWQKIRTQLKKMLFPLVLVPLEVIIFALFAALVKYDESGAPHNPNAESISNGSEDGSNGSDVRQDGGTGMSLGANTTKLYPCKCREFTAGPAPTVLDWYGHCVRVSVNKLGGLGACSPRKISHSEIASEAMFGPKKKIIVVSVAREAIELNCQK